MLFIGSIASQIDFPSAPELESPTLKLQARLIEQLSSLKIRKILSVAPFRQWSRSGKFILPRKSSTYQTIPIMYIGVINIEPLKSLILGFYLFTWIVFCAKRNEKIFIYNQGVTHQTLPFIILGAKIKRAETISCITDIDAVPHEASLIKRAIFYFQKWSIRHLQKVIGLNVAVKELINEDQPFYHLYGFAVDETFANALASLSPKEGQSAPFHILYTGSLNEVRGISTFLEAGEKLDKKKFVLHILGRGELQSAVEQATEKNQNMIYHGFLSDEERLQIYKQADILVNPHKQGSMEAKFLYPSKITEYLLTSRAVVSTAHAIPQDLECFMYISHDDSSSAIASAIESVSENMNDYQRKAEKGKAYLLKNKSWQVLGKEIRAFL